MEKKQTIKLNIPSGVDEGSRIRLRGSGDVTSGTGQPGDLFVVTHMKSHDSFLRDNENLIYETDVDYPIAVLGGDILVPTLNKNAKLVTNMPRYASKHLKNAQKVYNFLKQVAEENLGKKFLVKIPKNCNINYDFSITFIS